MYKLFLISLPIRQWFTRHSIPLQAIGIIILTVVPIVNLFVYMWALVQFERTIDFHRHSWVDKPAIERNKVWDKTAASLHHNLFLIAAHALAVIGIYAAVTIAAAPASTITILCLFVVIWVIALIPALHTWWQAYEHLALWKHSFKHL